MPKYVVSSQSFLDLTESLPEIQRPISPQTFPKGLLHVIEMGAQVVHAEGPREVRFVPPAEKFGHVPEVAQSVVDRRCCEHEQRLRTNSTIQQVIEPVVSRPFVLFTINIALSPGIPEVVCLINQDNVREFRYAPESFGEITFSVKVGMAEDSEVAKVSAATHAPDVRQPLPQMWLPDRLFFSFLCEKNDALALMQDEPFDKHKAHKAFSETDPIT